MLRAARGGDDKFVALLLEYHALVDLPSKENITPLMAAASVDYPDRASRAGSRTNADEGVLATMALHHDQRRRRHQRPLPAGPQCRRRVPPEGGKCRRCRDRRERILARVTA